jgi:hypothetical protein
MVGFTEQNDGIKRASVITRKRAKDGEEQVGKAQRKKKEREKGDQ